MKPKIERWIVYGNVLVGYIFDSKQFDPGTRILTNAIRYIDLNNNFAECLDGDYRLGEPGTVKEHETEFIGRKPESVIPQIDSSIFLNPRG